MTRAKLLILFISIFLLLVQPDSVAGQSPSNVSPIIRMKKEEIQAQAISRRATRAFGAPTLSNSLVKVDGDGNIHTYIRVHTFGMAERAQLEAYGVNIELVNEDYGIIQAWVPFDMVDAVAQLPFVSLITPPGYAVTRVGSVTTQGDTVLRADQVRALGFDGTGVRVGVISDGVDSMAAAQLSGDLPGTITIQTYAGSGDEGTAMLEIVHDLAPGAELGFCGPSTSAEMATCVNNLAGAFGADIIVDDLGFFDQAFFEDYLIANAVAGAVSSGVLYTSSAGNSAETHYQGDYVDSGDVNQSHLISAGNSVIDIPASGNVRVFLQWSEPFDANASDDYDLCLQAEDPATCAGFNFQQDGAGGGFPWEVRLLDCSGGCSVQVRLISGSPQTLELYVLDLAPLVLSDPADQVTADSIFGHPAVPGVLAAAAVWWSTPNTIEDFSSRGPSTIRFPATETRQKPDVTATDGVSITGAGGFSNPFFGTSAAAPHVAGVAALLMSMGTSADGAATALKQSAVDLGAAGTDTTFGAGRIDALSAYGFIQGALQFNLQVDNNDSSDDDFCFIATAAYGSAMEPQVKISLVVLLLALSIAIIRVLYLKAGL